MLSKGFGHRSDVSAIAGEFWEIAAVQGMSVHVDRVGSLVNVADGPTRPDEPSKMAPLRALRASSVAPTPFSPEFLAALGAR